jgi:hypothetical protein
MHSINTSSQVFRKCRFLKYDLAAEEGEQLYLREREHTHNNIMPHLCSGAASGKPDCAALTLN